MHAVDMARTQRPRRRGSDLARRLSASELALKRKLIQLREASGLSQTDVAKRMGVDKSAVSRFEKIDSNPRMSTLRAYAYAIEAMIYMHAEADRPHIYMNRPSWLGNNLGIDYSAFLVTQIAPAIERPALEGSRLEWNIAMGPDFDISQPQHLIAIEADTNQISIESPEHNYGVH